MNDIIQQNKTVRQKREQSFYDKFAEQYDLCKKINYDPVDLQISQREFRRWNSYWGIYRYAISHYKKGARLLDFGSGPGENALRFYRIGYSIDGFDISPKNVETAKKQFETLKNNCLDCHQKVDFKVAFAEKLPYKDQSFDIICGIDILHHIDIEKGITECWRVLKSNGVAYFREPIESVILDKIRNNFIFRYLFPNKTSLKLHITEDERKLTADDLKLIESIFPNIKIEKFYLFSRFDRFIRSKENHSASFLEQFDALLLESFPSLRKYCSGAIIILKKDQDASEK